MTEKTNQDADQQESKPTASGAAATTSGSTTLNRFENMQVAVRLRPMTERERQKGLKRIVEIEQNTVQLMNPKHTHDRYKKFTFDYSYWSYDGFKKNDDGIWVPDISHPNGINYVDQERVFRDLGQFLLDNAVEGYNSALLAYGQTGSGKSYTVSGYGANEGILPRFARAIYVELDKCTISSEDANQSKETIKSDRSTPNNAAAPTKTRPKTNMNQRYEVYFSMIEIYNEVVRDLLPKGSGPGGYQVTATGELEAGPDASTTSGIDGPTSAASRIASSTSGLTNRGLKIREHPVHGFFVENLSSYVCRNKEEIERRIEEGQLNKSIAATRMNETSSRGHTIYEFRIKQYKLRPGSKGGSGSDSSALNTTTTTTKSKSKKLSNDEVLIESVVQLVDLAGSERTNIHMPEEMQPNSSSQTATATNGSLSNQSGSSSSTTTTTTTNNQDQRSSSSVRGPKSSSSSTTGSAISRSSSMRPNASTSSKQTSGKIIQSNQQQQRFKESVSINQSLSALGNCIQVMSQNSQSRAGGAVVKIPYRDSALTKLLNRCCLSGNSKVVIIATLSPADCHFDETLSTLRFADRAKQIRTHAVINQTTRRASLADGGATGLLMQPPASLLKSHHNKKLRQIAESGGSSGSQGSTGGGGGGGAGSDMADALATPTRKRTVAKRAGGTNGGIPVSNRMANSRSNPTLAKADSSSKTKSTGNERRSRQATRGEKDSLSRPSDGASGDGDRIRKSRSEHRLASLGGYNNGEPNLNDNNFDDEEEEYITDLGDLRDGFISPESDDSMAALADEDLSPDEKIEILNRMLNNSGPNERILAIQEEGEPEGGDKGVKRSGAQARRLQNNKIRAEIKQVSLISSTLKRTNPYITNLNADEQLSGVLSYMIKQGETIIGKSGDCDVVIHGTEIRARHAKIIRNEDGIFLESVIDEQTASTNTPTLNPTAINIRLNGDPVEGRVQLHHCDRILFGTNSYFVVANLSDKKSVADASANRVADLDLVTYEMARDEVLRGVMREDQNKNVLKEIKGYTHRPGTGKGQKKQIPSTSSDGAVSDEKKPNQTEQSTPTPAASSRNQSKDTIHKLRRSMTIQDNNDEEGLIRADEIKLTNQANINDIEENSELGLSEQDEIYRKQLMEDTYDYVIPVTEVNAIANEMGIKVSYELKIVNGEEQLPHHTFGQYYDSNTSDAFSSSSVGEETNEQQQQHSDNNNKTSTGKNNSSAGQNSNTSGFSDSAQQTTTATANSNNNNDGDATQHQSGQYTPQGEVTYLSELHELDIPPALYIKVHLTEFDMDFYWEKEKFQNRRYKMLELYGPWSLGGKSALVEYLIEQSRIQGNYLIDPFVDDPSTNLVLIGHSQITLKPIAHQTDKRQSYDIININDETMGSLNVEAIPCHINPTGSDTNADNPGEIFSPFNEQDLATKLIEDTSQLLGKKLAFMLRIVSCNDLIAKYNNIFCQYSLGSRNPLIRTRAIYHTELESISTSANNNNSDDNNSPSEVERYAQLNFNHSHFICFESVTKDLLDFLEYGFLTIQVVGLHRVPKQMVGQSPSMITTIINSINKYKSKIEQASNYGSANYSNGDYYLGSAHSSFKMDGQGSQNGQKVANSLTSNSAKTINMYDQGGVEYDENGMLINGIPQENIIDMILTKRKLDRAENQLHYLKRTVNIAEHYNKKHIPIKVVKKLLNSYGQEVDGKSLNEVANEATVTNQQEAPANKKSGCIIQ